MKYDPAPLAEIEKDALKGMNSHICRGFGVCAILMDDAQI